MNASDLESLSSEDVCNLPRNELRDRQNALRREVACHVIRREALTDGMAFEFAFTPAMQQTLKDLVAYEQTCCGALQWSLRRPLSDTLRLSVQGLSPDSDFFRDLGCDGASPPRLGPMQRIAKAAGFGAVTAFVLCCVIPLGLSTVFAVAVAAPFARFDHPFVIAAGAFLLAVLAWFWMWRRASTACIDCY